MANWHHSLLISTALLIIPLGSLKYTNCTFTQKMQQSADCSPDDCKSMSCLQFMATHELIMELNWGSNTAPVLPIHSAFPPFTSHITTYYWSSYPCAECFIPSLPHLLCASVSCIDCGKDFCPSFPQISILQCFRTGYWHP